MLPYFHILLFSFTCLYAVLFALIHQFMSLEKAFIALHHFHSIVRRTFNIISNRERIIILKIETISENIIPYFLLLFNLIFFSVTKMAKKKQQKMRMMGTMTLWMVRAIASDGMKKNQISLKCCKSIASNIYCFSTQVDFKSILVNSKCFFLVFFFPSLFLILQISFFTHILQ